MLDWMECFQSGAMIANGHDGIQYWVFDETLCYVQADCVGANEISFTSPDIGPSEWMAIAEENNHLRIKNKVFN